MVKMDGCTIAAVGFCVALAFNSYLMAQVTNRSLVELTLFVDELKSNSSSHQSEQLMLLSSINAHLSFAKDEADLTMAEWCTKQAVTHSNPWRAPRELTKYERACYN